MTDVTLVTGGLGYVGGRILAYLSKKPGYSLRITSRKPIGMLSNQIAGCELLELDLDYPGDHLQAVCKGVTNIIHLAALNEIDSAKFPDQALKVNGSGTLQLLNAAIEAGVQRFIYFSTAHAYGSPLEGFINEEILPRPTHPYAITHRTAEDFVLSARDNRKINGIVLRLSNGFGAPVSPQVNRWTLLVNDLCRQAVTKKKLVLRSSGLQKRDFITLEDICRAVEHCLELTEEKCDNGLFNLGGECALPVFDMAEMIASRCEALFGFKPDIIRPVPGKDETSLPLEYSINKLKATGFQLKQNIEQEIDSTLAFCAKAFS